MQVTHLALYTHTAKQAVKHHRTPVSYERTPGVSLSRPESNNRESGKCSVINQQQQTPTTRRQNYNVPQLETKYTLLNVGHCSTWSTMRNFATCENHIECTVGPQKCVPQPSGQMRKCGHLKIWRTSTQCDNANQQCQAAISTAWVQRSNFLSTSCQLHHRDG